MIMLVISILLLVASEVAHCDEAVDQVWEQHFGSGSLFSQDRIISMVTGLDGSIYVSGDAKNEGVVTIKYDSTGTEIWRAAKAGWLNPVKRNMAVDSEGNAFVASEGFELVKYDSQGNEAWTMVSNLDGFIQDFLLDRDGNSILAGMVWDSVSNWDYMTLKIDPLGQILWSKTYGASPDDIDHIYAMDVDDSCNVYVTGISRINDNEDVCTIKYDPSGEELWMARFDGSGSGLDIAFDIKVDSSHNVILVGTSVNAAHTYQMITHKYDVNGNALWNRRISSESGGQRVLVDELNNVYAVGKFHSNEGRDLVIVKYDPSGTLIWEEAYENLGSTWAIQFLFDANGNILIGVEGGRVLQYNRDGELGWIVETETMLGNQNGVQDLAIRPDGLCLVAGSVEMSPGNNDFSLLAFDAELLYQWSVNYDGPRDNLDWSNDMALDQEGNIYITGGRRSNPQSYSTSDIITHKYSPGGQLEWFAVFEIDEDDVWEWGEGEIVRLDPSENVFVAGRYFSDTESDEGFQLLKYTSSGELLWVRQLSNTYWAYEMPVLLQVDNDGNSIMSLPGNEGGSGLDATHFFTIKLDPQGNTIWSYTLAGDENLYLKPMAMQLDSDNNIYLTGLEQGLDGNWNVITIKISPDGNEEWSAPYENPQSNSSMARITDIDSNGNIYVCISEESGAFGSEGSYTLIKYDSAGQLVWSTQDQHDNPESFKITIDHGDNLYLAGVDRLLKYDPAGNLVWVQTADGSVPYSEGEPAAISVDMLNNIYVAKLINFDPWNSTGLIMTVRYNPDGSEAWRMIHDEDGIDAAHSIALNATSQIIVSGNNYYSGGSFGPEMMRSVSTTIKYQQPEFPVMVEKIAKPQEFKLEQNYPNPFNPSTKIHYQLPEDTQVSIVIYDVLGREVVTLVKDQMPAGQHNVVWEGRDSLGKMMCTGIYFCRMESVDYNKTIKMVYLR